MKKEIEVLQEPKINHSLNLSMTTSDLIELYIEENITKLTKEYDDLIKKLEYLKQYDSNSKIKEQILKQILKHYRKVKLPFKPTHCDFRFGIFYDSETITISKMWFDSRYSISEFAKSRDEIRNENYCFGNAKICDITLFGQGFSLNIPKDAIPESLHVLCKNKEQLREIAMQKSEIYKKLWDIKQQYLEVNNTRKVKAKFTKKALANTTEGSKILEFLSTIDSIKSLN